MCGIIGIVGKQPVADRLVDGLRRMEYRGYDSAGVCTLHDGQLVRRRRGKTPSQIAPFVNTAHRQGEASLIAGLLVHSQVAEVDASGRGLRAVNVPRDVMGCRFCDAYEAYLHLHHQQPPPPEDAP